MAGRAFLIVLGCCLIGYVYCGEPNPPSWPSQTVYVADPSNPQETQKVVDQWFSVNGGHNPPWNGQWSNYRFAALFKPGSHNVTVDVGYYTSIIGLGQQPTDTNIQTVRCDNGAYYYSGGALANFWRSAENFYTKPVVTFNNDPTPAMMWAVSQASPLRRVYIDGDLDLFEYNYGCCAGYASGGFLADSTITGAINPGSQQQWFTRNTQMGSWVGGNWNMVFAGNSGGLPSPHCSNSGGAPITSVDQTPVIAEKPYIVISSSGQYSLMVPSVETSKVGPTTNFNNGQMIDFSNVYVSTPSDDYNTINDKLNQGLHLVFTPGIYNFTGTIVVSNPNTVVLGMGFPTLVSNTGLPVLQITGSEGVRVAGILLQAGPQNTSTLLEWGTNDPGNPSNPGFLYDCFARVGGTNDPSVQQLMADTMVQIKQGYVVIDNAWLWRADHGVSGLVYNSDNPNLHGLQVYSDNVITYGLAVEHQLEDLVQWYGENGQVYFFQSELPYDVTQSNFGDPGYVGFRVDPSVTNFQAYGMGVYCYFRDYAVTTANAISTGSSSSIQFTNSVSIFLNGMGQITHVINGQGDTVSSPAETSYVC